MHSIINLKDKLLKKWKRGYAYSTLSSKRFVKSKSNFLSSKLNWTFFQGFRFKPFLLFSNQREKKSWKFFLSWHVVEECTVPLSPWRYLFTYLVVEYVDSNFRILRNFLTKFTSQMFLPLNPITPVLKIK